MSHYQDMSDRLLRAGRAYLDFSSPGAQEGEYKQFREVNLSEGLDRRARGGKCAVRFKTPEEGSVRLKDLVYGDIETPCAAVGDFVLLRSDGQPTYHLSVVADDVDMGVSHVIRGADHLPNAAKHILIYQALGIQPPVHAHLPLILGTDRKRLSKRHGATSLAEYGKMGILPVAARNYLALLGWSPGTDDEVLAAEELRELFRINEVNKANAVFDPAKLEWMNKQHISRLSAEDLVPFVQAELKRTALWEPAWMGSESRSFLCMLDLLKTRVASLADFATYGQPFFSDQFEYEPTAVEKYLPLRSRDELKEALVALRADFASVHPFDLETTEISLRRIAEEHQLKTGLFIGAVRLATTGRSRAPGIFEVIVALGRERTLHRLDQLIKYME
jgi:glutamyl-tRNA synthetase